MAPVGGDAPAAVPGLEHVPHLPLDDPRAVARFLARCLGIPLVC
jgi:hypothetical protein